MNNVSLDEALKLQKDAKKAVADAAIRELAGIKAKLEGIREATGRSIEDLLGLKKATTTQKKSPAKKVDAAEDKKYRDWIKASKDQTHVINGKDKLIEEGTRLTQNIRDYVDSLDK